MLVMAGAAHEVCALATNARQRARGNAVAIHIEVPRELLDLLERRGIEHLATVGAIAVVPSEALHHPVVHADVEIGGHEHRGLEAFG